jgi:hypothetical protein
MPEGNVLPRLRRYLQAVKPKCLRAAKAKREAVRILAAFFFVAAPANDPRSAVRLNLRGATCLS